MIYAKREYRLSPRALQELIKNLRVFYKCPSCSAEYETDDIRFLGKVDQHCFMQLNCSKCSLPVLATVLLSAQEVNHKSRRKQKVQPSRSGLGFDASRRERTRFMELGAISSQEIADMYSYLRDQK